MIRIKIIKESKTLLQELNYEQVKQRLNSKKFKKLFGTPDDFESNKNVVGLYNRFIQGIEDSIPDDIEEKYKANALNWIISRAMQRNSLVWEIILTAPGHLRKNLEIFYQIKELQLDHFLDKKDINQISNTTQLSAVVNKARPKYKKHLANKVNKTLAKEGEKLIFSNDKWNVYIPENKAAACSLGKGTEWCTAAPGLDYYNAYHKPDDPLIIFKSKKSPKKDIQLHFGTKQFMDINDEPIHDRILFKLVDLLKGNKHLPKEVLDEISAYEYKDLGSGREYYKTSEKESYTLNDKKHRENGPAYLTPNGGEYWYQNDKLHREDGPAFINPGGLKIWYLNDKKHRKDGPAFEHPNGNKVWYLNDKIHREDGPAIEHPNGNKEWYQNDKLHRDDGPAIVIANGPKYWYLNGREYGKGDTPPDEWIAAGGKTPIKEIFKKYLK